jgi:uncharacterized protein (DUF934 family)
VWLIIVIHALFYSHQMPLLLVFPMMSSANTSNYSSLTMTNDDDDDPETFSLIFKVIQKQLTRFTIVQVDFPTFID